MRRFEASRKDSEWAEVDVMVEVPWGDSRVCQAIRKSVLETLDEVASAGYGDGKRMFKRYGGDWSDVKALVNYYAESAYKVIKAESKADWKERKSYQEAGMEEPDPIVFAHSVRLVKECELEKLLVFACSTYGYAGGAHGGSVAAHFMYDKTTGKEVKEVVSPKEAGRLQEAMKSGLCEYFGCSRAELMDELQIEGSQIPWPQMAPYASKDGVVVVYQQYEIAPYAAGMPTFVIPWVKVRTPSVPLKGRRD